MSTLQFPYPPQGEHRGFRWDSRRWDRGMPRPAEPELPPLPPGPADQLAGAMTLPAQDYNLDFADDVFVWGSNTYNSLSAWLAGSGVSYSRSSQITVTGPDGRPHIAPAGQIAINYRSDGIAWVRSGMVDDGTGILTLPGMFDVDSVDFSFGVSVRQAMPLAANGPWGWNVAPLIFDGRNFEANMFGIGVFNWTVGINNTGAAMIYVRPDDRPNTAVTLRPAWSIDLSSPFKAVTTCRTQGGQPQNTSVNGSSQLGRNIGTWPTTGGAMYCAFNGEVRAIARNRVFMTGAQLQTASGIT